MAPRRRTSVAKKGVRGSPELLAWCWNSTREPTHMESDTDFAEVERVLLPPTRTEQRGSFHWMS